MLSVGIRKSSSPSVFRSDLKIIFCHNMLPHKGHFRLILCVGVILAGCLLLLGDASMCCD